MSGLLGGSYSCALYGAAPQAQPAKWATGGANQGSCSYLSGTSSYAAVVNRYTWALPGGASSLLAPANGTLATCAQACLSTPTCQQW